MFLKGYIEIRETAVPIKKLDFSVNCEKCHEKSDYQPGRSLVLNIFK